ncbi:hypothetical protein ABPG75_001594 [Micractinium tetrahymenae]
MADCDAAILGCETSVTTDVNRCGNCTTKCHAATQDCVDGRCTCKSGRADCNAAVAGCEADILSSVDYCGDCDTQCDAATQDCVGGQCVCKEGWTDCDAWAAGCETDLLTDVYHCGACGTPCAANQDCVGGQCTCKDGWMDCDASVDGCETNTLSDADHCGACSTACGANQDCVGGQCVCRDGWTDCEAAVDGCETYLLTDVDHCGSCATACPANQDCVEGRCTCKDGWLDLIPDDPADPSTLGCESDASQVCNPACNAVTQTCVDNVCRCKEASGFGDCDHTGVCADLSSNPQNYSCPGKACNPAAAVDTCGLEATCSSTRTCVACGAVIDGSVSRHTWADCNNDLNGSPSDGSETELHSTSACSGCGDDCSQKQISFELNYRRNYCGFDRWSSDRACLFCGIKPGTEDFACYYADGSPEY